MKKPIIGIVTNVCICEEGPYKGGERLYVNRDYIKNILKSGGIPVLLPIIDDLEVIKKQIESIDGLLLSGGQDVNPNRYGEDISNFLGAFRDDRDFFELQGVQYAFSLKKPIFGICRGLQLLNVAFGGSLHQDIPNELGFDHNQKNSREEPHHIVEIAPDSNLYKILGVSSLETNSFHHQCVKKLAPLFRISASSKDGIVEAIEGLDHFVLGVQWHPEMMTEKHSMMEKLFSAFVDASR